MLKIWLKLVLKGRCARKSRSGFEGCLDASERSFDYGASSRLFNFLFFYFFYFLPLEPGSSVQADSGRLLLTPSGANLGPSHKVAWYLAKFKPFSTIAGSDYQAVLPD